MGTGRARAAWEEIAQLLSVQGKPEPASANVLSEHEIEGLDKMTPQSQAQLLLERSINHYRGANDQIATRVDSWRGKIKLDQSLNSLFTTALNSDDLRVRAAAIEIDLACRNLGKSSSTVDRLEPDAHVGEQGPRANALWDIALLGNRGVQPERALQILLASIHDSNVNIRNWEVEGLAYLGTSETVTPLLQVFHDDPSAMIRERAACGLAQSGMLNEKRVMGRTIHDGSRSSLSWWFASLPIRQDERALQNSMPARTVKSADDRVCDWSANIHENRR